MPFPAYAVLSADGKRIENVDSVRDVQIFEVILQKRIEQNYIVHGIDGRRCSLQLQAVQDMA